MRRFAHADSGHGAATLRGLGGHTYCAVYTVKFADVIYVLNCFQKKSKRAIRTPGVAIALIKSRLRLAEADYRGERNLEIQMQTKSLVNVALVLGMIVSAGSLDAQERGSAVSTVPAAAFRPPHAYVQPFGVPLAPPVYFVNFLLLYFSNPEIAAYMPAYRAALPQEVYQCLVENPLGCPYADMAPFFAEQALASGGGSRNKNTDWPVSCQTDPRWQALAPPEYRRADQINEPLGTRRAEQLARAFGIEQEMILTDREYACLIGGPGLETYRELIIQCSIEFTNSNGHAVVPLSSYGLFPDEQGGVRSLCASEDTVKAPCLQANEIFFGPLQAIAAECGFEEKLRRLTTETPMIEFAVQGHACQDAWAGACIAELACPGNGGQSNNSCAPSLANPE